MPALACTNTDDQLFVDDRRDFFPGGNALHLALEIVLIHQQPLGHGGDRHGGEASRGELAGNGVAANLDRFADLRQVAGDADLAAVHRDMAVIDHLAGGAAGIGQAEAVDHVVEPGFQELEQNLAGDAAAAQRDLVIAAELAFQ